MPLFFKSLLTTLAAYSETRPIHSTAGNGFTASEPANHDKSSQLVFIQTHDFPDHDAIASAFGLASLLERYDYTARILYRGNIRSPSLLSLIHEVGIALEAVSEESAQDLAQAPLILIDGNPTASNAAPLTQRLVAVIDHHPGEAPVDCPFTDIRSDYGACSSIIASYWRETGCKPPRSCATALLMGIQVDTDFLTRKVSPGDLEAHAELFFIADSHFTIRELKASLSVNDLKAVGASARRAKVSGKLLFTTIPFDCTSELISILADFYLKVRDIEAAVIVETGGDRYHVSIRSRPGLSAARLVKRALAGIGGGGGHDRMAGGTIDPGLCPDENDLYRRFKRAVEEETV